MPKAACGSLSTVWAQMLGCALENTTLVALGNDVTYSPWLLPLEKQNEWALDSAATLHAPDEAWRRMVSLKKERLSVVILGGSVSAGCGQAADKSARCTIQYSWGRRLASLLSGLRSFAQMQTMIWSKNAIYPDYYQGCTGRFVNNADMCAPAPLNSLTCRWPARCRSCLHRRSLAMTCPCSN